MRCGHEGHGCGCGHPQCQGSAEGVSTTSVQEGST